MQESSRLYLDTVQITLMFIKKCKGNQSLAGKGLVIGNPYPHIAPCIVRLLNDPNNLNFQKDFHDLTTPRNCERGMHTELQLRLHNCPAETNHNSEDFPSKAWVIHRLYILIISKLRLII